MKKVMSSGKWQHYRKQTKPDSYRTQFYGVRQQYNPFGTTAPDTDTPASTYKLGECYGENFNKQANEVLHLRRTRGLKNNGI